MTRTVHSRGSVISGAVLLFFGFLNSNNVFAVDDLQFSISLNAPVAPPVAVVDTALQSFCPDLLAGNESSTSQLRDVCEFVTGDTPGAADQVKIALEELSPKPNSSATTAVSATPPIKFSPSIGLRLAALRRSTKRTTFLPLGFPRNQLDENSQTEPGGLLSQRLSGFVNLSYVDASQYETNTEIGFDSNLQSVTAGADYRLRNNTFVGIAPQYNHMGADLTDANSSLSTQQLAVTGYATHFLSEHWYLEGTLSYGRQYLDLQRYIDFDTNTAQINVTAEANTTSNQYSISGGTGYDFLLTKNISGVVSATAIYTHASIDGYDETNAGNFNLSIDGQSFKSMTSRVSAYISQVHALSWAVLIPQLQVSWIHEAVKTGEAITAHFVTNPGTVFSYNTKAPDPDYFVWGIDLQLMMPMGRSAFLSLANVQQLRDRSELSINAGFRMEFQR